MKGPTVLSPSQLPRLLSCPRNVVGHLLPEANDNQGQIAASYGNLGLIYQTRGDLEQAEAMFKKSLGLPVAARQRKRPGPQTAAIFSSRLLTPIVAKPWVSVVRTENFVRTARSHHQGNVIQSKIASRTVVMLATCRRLHELVSD